MDDTPRILNNKRRLSYGGLLIFSNLENPFKGKSMCKQLNFTCVLKNAVFV